MNPPPRASMNVDVVAADAWLARIDGSPATSFTTGAAFATPRPGTGCGGPGSPRAP
jgi:hypothetical protein